MMLVTTPESNHAMEGEWILSFKTVGERVTLDLTIDVEGSNTLVRCSGKAFHGNESDDLIGWEMEVPVMNGMATASFQGRMKDLDSMYGILLINEYPYDGRAVKWSASRKRTTHK